MAFWLCLLTLPTAWAIRLRSEADASHSPGVVALARSREGSSECASAGQPVQLHFPDGSNWTRHCVEDVCRPQTNVEKAWVSFPLVERNLRKRPKLVVAVLAMFNMTHPEVWLSWVRNAEASGLPFTFMIHSKDARKEFQDKQLRRYVLNESSDIHRTRWCKVAEAEYLVMRRALDDPEVTHLAVVSSDSIPLKSLRHIHRELEKQPVTRMCMDWTHNHRAETWFVMQRADIELFMQHLSFVDQHFRPLHLCEEERMWMYPLVLRSWMWGKQQNPLLDDCVMWTDWGKQCQVWASHVLMGDFDAVRSARHYPAVLAHPRTYLKLTAAGLRELQQSSFWWARKFAKRSISADNFTW
mmetsp:Transcript_49363/g.143088  ORF Transcript_49363/g.143088 Transcript_49363/m.143088 type:complete len:355 (+) Transcript_49363:95-1159(+)